MERLVGYIGRKTLKSINYFLNLFAFTYKILRLIFKRPTPGKLLVKKIIFEQIYFTAVEALPIIIPVALIIGSMILVQFAKISGQYDLGKITILLIVREFGPIITALLVILRSATAVIIEISHMNVLNEINAMEMCGIDPIQIVCLPRLIGITSAILSLFIIFDIVSIMGGYAIVWGMTDIPMGNFTGQIVKALTPSDITVGIVKAICFGVTISVVSLYHGFKTKKRITNIPVSISKGTMACFFYCLLINIFISVLFYL